MDDKACWRGLLMHRYGDFASSFLHGSLEAFNIGSIGSIWWRDLLLLDRSNNHDGWFRSCIRRRLGTGGLVDFWNDHGSLVRTCSFVFGVS